MDVRPTKADVATPAQIAAALAVALFWFGTCGYPLLTLSDQHQITLGALTTALLVLVLTGIVARNVPDLLEIMILRRLPMDRGVRFAIITISRYILVIIGVVVAFSEMGIGWSKVQWLVAAMTVGLGFGLQEIFANFISGLIILMPNKEFITGTFINWTLSDDMVCRNFTVGIAYGSDIRKAERLLREIAASNPAVLKDPAPVVLFKAFGESSLDFELQVFISGMDNYIPVWHNINCAIDDAFRKAGIEIAFPQRDIHIRSIEGNLPVVSWSPEKNVLDGHLRNTDAATDRRA
ncbi:MAG: mechanosensitive ion channel family protein [Solirubrobacterales bacterium]